jgi:hypothetical protein
MRYVVMLAAPPAAVGILLLGEPDAGSHRRREAFGSTKPQVSSQEPMDDLTGIEDDGLAAGLAVMSRKGAIRILDGEFPIDHAVRATDEIGRLKLRWRQ